MAIGSQAEPLTHTPVSSSMLPIASLADTNGAEPFEALDNGRAAARRVSEGSIPSRGRKVGHIDIGLGTQTQYRGVQTRRRYSSPLKPLSARHEIAMQPSASA